MSGYRKNELLTAWDIVANVENWWAGWDLRLRRQARPELLRLRNGVSLICRGGTRDWDIVQEVFFVGAYTLAMDFLRRQPGDPTVLDLGGNIGLFSLLAASTNPRCRIHAFEPGPPNHDLFESNRLLNPHAAGRITLTREAAGGESRETEWFFDAANPGGSSLFAATGEKFPVKIRAFREILAEIPGEIALVKFDIEGSEYELLESAPADFWHRVGAVVIELHDDPRSRSKFGKTSRNVPQPQFLRPTRKRRVPFFEAGNVKLETGNERRPL